MNRTLALTLSLALVFAALTLSACGRDTGTIMVPLDQGPDYSRPLPPGQLGLRRVEPGEIPDFTVAAGNTHDLRRAIDRSLHYLAKPSSQKYYPYGEITHAQVVQSLQAFAALLDRNLPPAEMNRVLRERFDVYESVGWDGRGTVLFTGYYTPIFDASPVRTDRFRYPLYKTPPDLAKGPEGEILGRRTASGSLEPYPARQQIESANLLRGQELFWLADAFDVYIAHVQGSARLRMPDGRMVTAAYGASNGHPYQSVAKALIDDGKIAAQDMSLQAMIAYFRAHPQDVQTYVWRNPRFVFFTQGDELPHGSINEPVTPWRTVATDKTVFPRAALTFLSTRLPVSTSQAIQQAPYTGFALDQDTGGAIRAPGRCDLYIGVGDAAGQLAGHVKQEGRLYYLFLKPTTDGSGDIQASAATGDR